MDIEKMANSPLAKAAFTLGYIYATAEHLANASIKEGNFRESDKDILVKHNVSMLTEYAINDLKNHREVE